MRTLFFALIMLVVGCGDNLRPGLFVETRVASATLAAGSRVGARCSLVDDRGRPALDGQGNPLSEATTFTIGYEAPEAFATDDAGQEIAVRAGSATVRCAAPDLALADETPAELQIVPGPPARTVAHLDQPTAIAGEPDGVTCLVFDAFDNPIDGLTPSLAVSPSGAGTTTTATAVTATLAGEYAVSCLVPGAASAEPADLLVIPALPETLTGVLDPARTLYAIFDQVTLIASAFDHFGNRVDDASFAYASSPVVSSPAPARFELDQDGEYLLSASVTSPTQNDVPLSVSLPAIVDSNGPAIECMRLDTPSVAADAYMVQQAPATVSFPVHIGGVADVQSVTIAGSPASLDAGSGNYEAPVPIDFGMNFVDVVATDTNGVQNTTTCFVLAAPYFTPEADTMPGAIGFRLDPYAIGDPNPSGLDSLNDLFSTVLRSDALRVLVDQALSDNNPINDGSCGVFACEPDVNYNAHSLAWDTPSTTLSLISGGLRATVYLPNVRLGVRACGTTCCIGGSDITVSTTSISATVDFSLRLQGGLIRTALAGTPQVNVGTVTLHGSGFCGFILNLVQSFFSDTVKNAVQGSLTDFINDNVAPLLDQMTSSLDISTLAQSFAVPRLDGTGDINLGFGVSFSSLEITTARTVTCSTSSCRKASTCATTVTAAASTAGCACSWKWPRPCAPRWGPDTPSACACRRRRSTISRIAGVAKRRRPRSSAWSADWTSTTCT
jgi:hypothetical protein